MDESADRGRRERRFEGARPEIHTLDELQERLSDSSSLQGCALQGLDLSGVHLDEIELAGALFLGCTFPSAAASGKAVERGAAVFPQFVGLPYDPYRSRLYSVDELLDGFDAGGYPATRDFRIFTHFDRERRGHGEPCVEEALAQRIHDHGIDDALYELLQAKAGRGTVGIMGGHGTPRSAPHFELVARAAWELTRRGYFVASGGGPGTMEAANLGAYFANFGDPAVLREAIEPLRRADTFDGGQPEGSKAYLDAIGAYVASARQVIERFFGADSRDAEFGRERVEPGESLAVPTWFYGHEPSNLFSTHIAKYFANSIREDGLLAIATGGVIYAPGSAGTLQEVFMDLAQNHYVTCGARSAMVFLGKDVYREWFDAIGDFITSKGMDEEYGDLIALVDDPLEAVEFIEQHPPRLTAPKTPLYELLDG